MRKTVTFVSIAAAAGFMLYQLLHITPTHRKASLANDSNRETEPGTPAMTGAGEGKVETTEDSDGASARHLVGRGVI
jgi:hypothetical protein